MFSVKILKCLCGLLWIADNSDASSITITVNEQTLFTGSSEVTYNYQDGELVDTTCKTDKSNDTSRMEYYDSKNNAIFVLNDYVMTKYLYFRTTLRSDRSNSYLDCYNYASSDNKTTKVRVYYVVKPRTYAEITVWADGVELFPMEKAELTFMYITSCMDGETVHLEYYLNNEISSKRSIKCESPMVFPYNYPSSKYQVQVTLKSDFVDSNPRIFGLQTDRILYQYTSGFNQWTMHYRFTNYELLNLTCAITLHRYKLKWFYQQSYPDEENKWMREFKVTTAKTQIKITKADNNTRIICMALDSDNKKGEVVLILHNYIKAPDVIPATTDVGIATSDVGIATSDVGIATPDRSGNTESLGNTDTSTESLLIQDKTPGLSKWIIVGIVAAVVLLSVPIVLYWIIYRKRKHRHQVSEQLVDISGYDYVVNSKEENDHRGLAHRTPTAEPEYCYATVAPIHPRNENAPTHSPYAIVDYSKKKRHRSNSGMLGDDRYVNVCTSQSVSRNEDYANVIGDGSLYVNAEG